MTETPSAETPPTPSAKGRQGGLEGEPPVDLDAPTVFDEIRRARSETSVAKSLLMRVLGMVVLVLAIWVVSRNVSWVDTLRIEGPTGGVAELQGEILGDWRSDGVEFEVSQAVDVAPRLARVGFSEDLAAAFEDAIDRGGKLRSTDTVVELPGGGAVVATDEGVAPEALIRGMAERIEWRPGMVRTLREMHVSELLPALGFLILASLCVVTRWWRLLGLGGCPTRWYDAFRYTYSGLFFNAVVPGINGGDVARAVAVVRNHPDRRGDALMTVVVDRAIGLVGMVLVGTVLVLTTDDRLASLKLPVSLFCLAVVLGAVLFFLPALRRAVRFETLVGRLPQGERLLRLDEGARVLLRSPREVAIALVFSFGNHIFNGMAVFAAAKALGGGLGFQDWVATMAIANTLAAVPISPGGLGVGEVLFGSLAELLGSSYAIGVATSLVYRLCLYAMSLLGGLVMLLPAARPSQSEAPASSATF